MKEMKWQRNSRKKDEDKETDKEINKLKKEKTKKTTEFVYHNNNSSCLHEIRFFSSQQNHMTNQCHCLVSSMLTVHWSVIDFSTGTSVRNLNLWCQRLSRV